MPKAKPFLILIIIFMIIALGISTWLILAGGNKDKVDDKENLSSNNHQSLDNSFSPNPNKENNKNLKNMKIKSLAFTNNQMIPAKYTCDQENINPSLEISDVPEEAKSLALIVDDPDAPNGRWVHWILWNISPDTKEIPENSIPENAIEGINSFDKFDYGGPCPPSGTHRYFFKLFALDTILDIDHNNEVKDLEEAMTDHVLEQAQLIGLYKRH